MSDERARRVGHNEALFRHVNETVEELNKAIDHITEDLAIICECGKLDCTEQIRVSREVYERTRDRSVTFLVQPGHELPDVEHIVERDDSYLIVEKDPAEARAVARETDPRT